MENPTAMEISPLKFLALLALLSSLVLSIRFVFLAEFIVAIMKVCNFFIIVAQLFKRLYCSFLSLFELHRKRKNKMFNTT
jgi:hypothetical protein